MKKLVITLALLLTAGTMFAQEVEKGSKQRWRNFETNRFVDNWELSVRGGANFFGQAFHFSDANADGFFNTDKIDWTVQAELVKWVNPIVGLRLGYEGIEFKQNPAEGVTNKVLNHIAHGDLMLNLTNWICRYKADRFYNGIFFIGAGIGFSQLDGDNDSWNREFVVPFGYINRFRLCDAWTFDIELRDNIVKDNYDELGSLASDWTFGNLVSVTGGFTWKFSKVRSFNAYTPIDKSLYDNRISALEKDLQNANDKNAEYQKQIDRYKKQLSDKERELQEALRKAAQSNPAVAVNDDVTLSIFFPIGSAEVSDKNEINIKYMADVIKASNKTFTITGYADNQTGSENRNMELSQQRAEAVYNALINAGVDKSKIKVDYKGCSVQPFDKDYLNRVAIIK